MIFLLGFILMYPSTNYITPSSLLPCTNPNLPAIQRVSSRPRKLSPGINRFAVVLIFFLWRFRSGRDRPSRHGGRRRRGRGSGRRGRRVEVGRWDRSGSTARKCDSWGNQVGECRRLRKKREAGCSTYGLESNVSMRNIQVPAWWKNPQRAA